MSHNDDSSASLLRQVNVDLQTTTKQVRGKPIMKTKSRSLNVERLEKREVFTGNVVASAAGGVLHLTGDSQADLVEIRGSAGGHLLTVSGLGTTINGSNSPITFNVPSGRIDGTLLGGDDYVYLHDATIDHVQLIMGDGNDDVYMKNVIATGTVDNYFDMGVDAGHDVVNLENDHILGNLHVELGNGDDYFALKNTQIDFLMQVAGGAGYDTYSKTNSSAGQTLEFSSFERRTFPDLASHLHIPPGVFGHVNATSVNA
jgi:hypothetical protein